jgi:hypothetical protein
VREITFSVVTVAVLLNPTAPPTPVVEPVPATGLPWVETFADSPNGAQSDAGATAWKISRSAGKFDVQNGALVIQGGGTEGIFETTQLISIAGVSSVTVFVQVTSQGPLEAQQDYVRYFVTVDDGPRQLVGEVTGAQNGVATLFGNFSGNTIRLEIRSFVSFEDESYTIDNVQVIASTAGPPVPVPAPVLAPVPAPVPKPTTPTSPTGPSPTHSSWLGPNKTPLIAAAAAHLPDGRILFWSSRTRTDFRGDQSQTWIAIYNASGG